MRGLFVLITLSAITVFGYLLYKKTTTTEIVADTPMSESIDTKPTSEKVSAPPVARENEPTNQKTILSSSTLQPIRKRSFDQPYEYFQTRLKFLESCFERRCKLPNKDPKSYEFAVYTEIEKTLTTLRAWQQRHDFKDERIPLLMNSFLAYEKSEIKVAALEILSTQLKDERVVPHVLEHVLSQAYPTPIPLAMKELSRYKEGKFKKEIEDTVVDVLTHGSIYSAVEVAKNIKTIMNSQNRQKLGSTLDELSTQPLSKDIYLALKLSLGDG